MTKLNAAQEALLARITESKAREKLAIDALEAQLKVLKQGVGYPDTHALVREAYEQGVPKRQIGMAYGTTDASTINRIIEADNAPTPLTYVPTTSAAPTVTTLPTVTEDSVEVTLLTPESEDYPEILRARENPGRAAKIQCSFQNPTPCGKIGGLSAVVWLDHKIAITDAPTPLTDLIDGPREEWPAALEEVLAPYLNS